MKAKFLNAIKLAFSRFLLGAIGTWCTLGPIVLLSVSESTKHELLVSILVLLLGLCYAVVLVICLRMKWEGLKNLAAETKLAMCFMLLGLLLNEITGLFLAIKHKLVLVYAFAGFLLTELVNSELFVNAFNDYLRKHTPDPQISPIKNGLSAKQSSVDLPIHNDGYPQQNDEVSVRLTENQRRLSEDAKQERSSVDAQTENQQLREIINSLGYQLQMSENQVARSAIDNHEVVGLNATLESKLAESIQHLAERDETIETLKRMVHDAAKMKNEIQELFTNNHGLQKEFTSQRIQLNARETELQELARHNLEVLNRYEGLKTEVTALHRQVNQLNDRDLQTARQHLAHVELCENYYRKQQSQLEARIIPMQREISEAKNQALVLDDTCRRLRETERVCQELVDENCRLWKELSGWQEHFAASDDTRTALNSDGTGVHPAPNGSGELSWEWERLLPAKAHEHTPHATAIQETQSWINGPKKIRGTYSQLSSEDPIASVCVEKGEEASWVLWTSIKQQWRLGALAAFIAVITGIIAMGGLGNRFSPLNEASMAAKSSPQEYILETVAKSPREPASQLHSTDSPKSSSQNYRDEAISKPRKKPVPQLPGAVETVLPTAVYSGPSENSALVATIQPGTKVNVIDSSYGWLEIRSKYGRPPGFIRQDSTIVVAQN